MADPHLMLQSAGEIIRRAQHEYRKEQTVMGRLEGKVAVITAATSGMALATAKRFVEEGAYVFITGRRQDKLDEAIKLIGRNVTGVQGDAANLADLDRLYETVKREKGRIDILFASAGFGEFAAIGNITEEHFDKTFDLNVRGTLFTVQKALPLFNDGGSIFLNGSIASIKGFPAFSVYSASKAAIRSFARTWLVDLKDRKIRVNILSPGTIDTPALDPLGQEAKEGFKSLIPRGEMGTPEEIASVALFLASDDSSFVNGIELFVDGGTAQI
jgi:NAD(P)-dependent dehydrogenase (short-subunit alcohol dehydrogenase family)